MENEREITSRLDRTNRIFLERVDKCGGWKRGTKYVSFYHDGKRECVFGNDYLRTEWWTTICDIDEYLWWKISDIHKAKIKAIVRKEFSNEISRIA